MKLACVVATRGRPELLIDTLKLTLSNITLPETRIMVAADADDHGTQAAINAFANDPRIVASVAEREDTIAEKWNRALNEIEADVYMPMCDDHAHITPGFDAKVIEGAAVWPDGIAVVYSPLINPSFPGVQAVTRRFADLMGYIYPPYFPFWFVDHWLDDVARITMRISEVEIQMVNQSHLLPTQEMREPAWWATFFDVVSVMRRRQAHTIIDAMDETPERKQILRRMNHPLVEHRSKFINNAVRMNLGGHVAKTEPDARYRRIKAKAVAMLRDMLADFEKDEPAASRVAA